MKSRIIGAVICLFALFLFKLSFFDTLNMAAPKTGSVPINYAGLIMESFFSICGIFIFVLADTGRQMIREPRNKVLNCILLLLTLIPGLAAAIWLDIHMNGRITGG